MKLTTLYYNCEDCIETLLESISMIFYYLRYYMSESPDKYNRLSGLIKLLSPKRSECFDTWIKLAWCIINICNKEKIPRRKCYELIPREEMQRRFPEIDISLDTMFQHVKFVR